jgi:NAD(P)H dehydrogenase (quinone)
MSKKIKKIIVILSNPDYEEDQRSNLLTKLCKKFLDSVQNKGCEVDFIDLYKEQDFNPLYSPESKDTKVLEYQIRIKEADAIVFFHPVWFSFMPAILKGFLDKVFVAGFAFKSDKEIKTGLLEKKLLVFTTDDRPSWENRFLYRDILGNFWSKAFADKCGMKSKIHRFGKIRTVKDKTILKWEKQVEKTAFNLASQDSLLDLI